MEITNQLHFFIFYLLKLSLLHSRLVKLLTINKEVFHECDNANLSKSSLIER